MSLACLSLLVAFGYRLIQSGSVIKVHSSESCCLRGDGAAAASVALHLQRVRVHLEQDMEYLLRSRFNRELSLGRSQSYSWFITHSNDHAQTPNFRLFSVGCCVRGEQPSLLELHLKQSCRSPLAGPCILLLLYRNENIYLFTR